MKSARYLRRFAQPCGAIAVLLSVSQLSAQQIVSASSVKISTDSAVVRPASAPLQLGWNVPWKKFQIHFWGTTQTTNSDVQAYLAGNMQGALYGYLHYLIATNNDDLSNYLGFWNGVAASPANRPTLEVTYYYAP